MDSQDKQKVYNIIHRVLSNGFQEETKILVSDFEDLFELIDIEGGEFLDNNRRAKNLSPLDLFPTSPLTLIPIAWACYNIYKEIKLHWNYGNSHPSKGRLKKIEGDTKEMLENKGLSPQQSREIIERIYSEVDQEIK